MIKPLSLLIALAACLLLGLSVEAQDEGRGVVKFALDQDVCTGTVCDALSALTDPRLFDVDPATGALHAADQSNTALALSVPTISSTGAFTLALRRDRTWSDGQPIDAYDLLFYLMSASRSAQGSAYYAVQPIVGTRLIDQYTLALRFDDTAGTTTPACDLLPRINFGLRPVHTVYPGFREWVDQQTLAGDFRSLPDWWRAFLDAHLPPGRDAAVTGGRYEVTGLRVGDPTSVFLPTDGTGTPLLELAQLPYSAVNAFIAGDTNLLLGVPVEQRAGVRLLADPNRGNVQIAEVPGRESLIIVLNFGNPKRPLPGIHPETGAVLDQGKNPLFSDPAVRRALQLAIDQRALIDGVLQKSALPLAGLYPPSSWAFDRALPQPETNLQQARQLLTDAGWIDNGVVRTCHGCQSAEEGTQLQFTLGSNGSDFSLADQIAKGWAQIGAAVYASGEDDFGLSGQTFDAYLERVGGSPYEDADPDRTLMLTPVGDILSADGRASAAVLNYGSYSNPVVTNFLAQARTMPGCDPVQRAAVYHQVQSILQTDLPFLTVAAPTEFYAAAPGIRGFAPRSGDPLWNVESWSVAP